MDEKFYKLRKAYESKSSKQGTSLQILVDIDGTLTNEQQLGLKEIYGITTLEELYDAYSLSPNPGFLDKNGKLIFPNPSQLETAIKACETYMTKEEIERFKKGGPRFQTGALPPKDQD